MVKTTSYVSYMCGLVRGAAALDPVHSFSPQAGKPPVIKDRPFRIFWATPTMQCQHFFNVDLNLQ